MYNVYFIEALYVTVSSTEQNYINERMFWHSFIIFKKNSCKFFDYIIVLYDYIFHFKYYNCIAERLKGKDNKTFIIARGNLL